MKKLLSVILAVIMILAVVPMAAFAEDVITETTETTETPEVPEKTAEKIEEVSIDFVYPAVGEAAVTDYILDGDKCVLASASWFEASSDKFIDEETTFSAGMYYIQATLKAQDGYEFAENVNVVINGIKALSIEFNEDGTITVIGGFAVEEKPEETNEVLAFLQKLIESVKNVFLTIVRFFGTMIGLK